MVVKAWAIAARARIREVAARARTRGQWLLG